MTVEERGPPAAPHGWADTCQILTRQQKGFNSPLHTVLTTGLQAEPENAPPGRRVAGTSRSWARLEGKSVSLLARAQEQ